jgi:hypothetical protein
MAKRELIVPNDFDPNVLVYQLDPREPIVIPEFTPSESPGNLPLDTLRYFRTLWYENGYARIKTPHDDAILLPSSGQEQPVFLLNSYRGLSDGEVLDRKPYLKEYRRQRRILGNLQDEAARQAQQDKLKRILDRIPDRSGLQGVEMYKLYLPTSPLNRIGIPIQGSDDIVISKSFNLGQERSTYDLPSKNGDQALYPHLGKSSLTLFIGGERFNPEHATRADYAARWVSLIHLGINLLKQANTQH